MTIHTTPGQAAFDAHYSKMVPHIERSDGGHWDDVAQAAINAQWIPCSERMPEHCTMVLALVKCDKRPIVAEWVEYTTRHNQKISGWHQDAEYICVKGDASIDAEVENVSHWMPLPQPPEVKP